MKKIVAMVMSLLLVGFISGCGSDSSSGDTTTEDSTTATQSGVYTTTFDGASAKTWYTEKATYNDITVNMANYSRNGDSVNITIGARSSVGSDTTDGWLSFFVNFPSGVTTGDIAATYVSYQNSSSENDFLHMAEINVGTGFTINITQATDDGTVVHVEGSFATTVYEDGINPTTLTVAFEFDAHST